MAATNVAKPTPEGGQTGTLLSRPCGRYRGLVSGERVPGGVVHKLPEDLRKALVPNPTALDAWKDITPLARNEFICWVEDAQATDDPRVPHSPNPGGA